jgi:hypothetical protein
MVLQEDVCFKRDVYWVAQGQNDVTSENCLKTLQEELRDRIGERDMTVV